MMTLLSSYNTDTLLDKVKHRYYPAFMHFALHAGYKLKPKNFHKYLNVYECHRCSSVRFDSKNVFKNQIYLEFSA